MGLLVYFEPESTCIFTRFLTIIVLRLKKYFAKMQECLFRKYFATLRMVWNELDNGLAILFRWHYNALPYQSMWLWQQATIELYTYDELCTTKDFHYVEVLIWYIGQVISYQDQIGIWFLLQDYNFSFQSRQKINCNMFVKLLSRNNEHF